MPVSNSCYKNARRSVPYTQIANNVLNDPLLSFRAKGVLVYLLSKPPDWKVIEADIVKHTTEGRHAVRTAIKELLDVGYLQREQYRADDGTFHGTVYLATDSPGSDFPTADSPGSDFPTADKRTLLNKDEPKTEVLNTDDSPPTPHSGGSNGNTNRSQQQETLPPGFVDFWAAYPRKKAKGDALNAWKQLSPDKFLQQEILDAIAAQKQGRDWIKDNGEFIPYPATWLRARQWEDEVTPPEDDEEISDSLKEILGHKRGKR